MTGITLTRRDLACNMHRFYRLDVQPDLLGAWCLVCEWGRIGRGSQLRSIPYPTEPEARSALAEPLYRRRRRGYANGIAGALLRNADGCMLQKRAVRYSGLVCPEQLDARTERPKALAAGLRHQFRMCN
jgi:predicted DNA-binding WGR domain protein